MNLFTRITHRDLKSKAKALAKDPIFWVRFSAYAIPLVFLLYVLYMNFLPFGYHKTFVIDVGTEGDTSGEFYLEPARTLSERKVAPDGTTYRELNGPAYAVFKPKAVLKDATITVSVEGDGVSIIPPVIDFDPSTVTWDYQWDFTKGIPSDFVGNAFMFDGEATFNGRDTRLELPDSADLFEDGPFTLYAEWTPKDSEGNGQQIVGHFNWELFQNRDSVSFGFGRMNDKDGAFHSIKYSVTPEFFDKKHTALAVYSPSENGYADFYVDGNFAGRAYFNSDTIWRNYGTDNLSLGWAKHYNYGKNPHLKGIIHAVNISSRKVISDNPAIGFVLTTNASVNVPLVPAVTGTLDQITLHVQ